MATLSMTPELAEAIQRAREDGVSVTPVRRRNFRREAALARAEYAKITEGWHWPETVLAIARRELPEWAVTLYRQSEKGARARGITWALTPADALDIVVTSNGRCQVTGLRFSADSAPGSRKRPFFPSLDRINSGAGYSRENCRLVLAWVNNALASYGDDVFWQIVDRAKKQRKNAERPTAQTTPQFG